ncbi:MAG: GNAT family N-acetyltransferase [Bacteroidia bacterium]|nr:GNAT family N-acetyltransferase [Bacteroidia bacterium]
MHIITESSRLLLREFRPGDGAWLYVLNEDPDVLRYTSDVPYGSVEVAETFVRNYDVYRTQGLGRWAMIRKDTGAAVGWCGLKYQPGDPNPDLGYRLLKSAWGQGYATEAAQASINYGFGSLGVPRLIARVVPENLASVKVLRKCGFVRIGETVLGPHPADLYELTPAVYAAHRQAHG